MPYQVLARKWRPKNFAEMVGQDAVVRTLANAFEQQRLHHAYLFTGTRGVGKTTIARIIAKCLNCEQGISATPCGKCSICQAIDAGQFVDLIEVDAASRTKVEDTRELLDNVQYAPSQGRFKIYLIDEVHMLSGHSFNALLKTLEEPPEHVKFLLATTDPQKLPITVLSRCLQFHLKGITPEIISQQLAKILAAENIPAETAALQTLAEAANGSMRDALSLLDQAIAFSNANLTAEAMRKLLGTTATVDLFPLLDALLQKDGEQLLQTINHLALQGISFPQILADFLNLLHRINVLQIIPNTNLDTPNEKIADYAKQFSKEDIQLFYQIGVLGQRDMSYAPSARSSFEMTLLRMLCFIPTSDTQQTETKANATAAPKLTKAAPTTKKSDNWPDIINAMQLGGMTKLLAENCVLDSVTEHKVCLHIDSKHQSLANEKQTQQLQVALRQYFNRDIKLSIEQSNKTIETPAKQSQQQNDAKVLHAKETLMNDPHVQSILQDFGGSIDENSIKSLKTSGE